MKSIVLLGVGWLAIAGALKAQEIRDAESLAAGYAKAFECSGKSSMIIHYVGASEPETIPEVKEVLAYRGVLLVKTINGSRQILDPARIVKMVSP